LLASAGDRVRIQPEEPGQNAIASMPQFDGLQAGEQACYPRFKTTAVCPVL